MLLRSGRIINYASKQSKKKSLDTSNLVKTQIMYDYITNITQKINESIQKCTSTIRTVVRNSYSTKLNI